MYRRHEREMAETMNLTPPTFLGRCTSYPVVASTMQQVAHLYERTKDSNGLVRYTLETAESGVKVAANTAKPVVNKLETPMTALDKFGCNQLDRVEKICPSLNKPTEELMKDTEELYNKNLKPTVDRINAVYKYGINKVDAVKTYTQDQVAGAKKYSTGVVEGATQVVSGGVTTVLDTVDTYVEKYLPEETEENGDEVVEKEEPQAVEKAASTVNRVSALTNKMRRRMYARAMRDLQQVRQRSQETIQKLTFTVDLLEYSRKHIDGVQSQVSEGVQATKDRLNFYWTELNKTGEELEMEDPTEMEGEQDDKETVTPTALERRALATARHLSMQLKQAMETVTDKTQNWIPSSLSQKLTDARTYTEDLYQQFSKTSNVKDLPLLLLTQTRERLSQVQETVTNVVYQYNPTNWVSPYDTREKMDIDMEEIESESGSEDGFSGYVPCVKS